MLYHFARWVVTQQSIEHRLAEADAQCRAQGVRLTSGRRLALRILLEAGRPLGAYAVQHAMAERGRMATPAMVYRWMGFLIDGGLAHRLERLNAYVACAHPGRGHPSQFLICQDCGRVTEITDLRLEEAVRETAEAHGFAVTGGSIEIIVRCPAHLHGGGCA